MKKSLIIFSILLSSILVFGQETLNNQSILELLELDFDSNIIKSKINSSQVDFNTSIEELTILKEKGVPSDVLALMIDKSKVEIETGVFFHKDEELKKIEPSAFAGTKTNALASSLTYGIAPSSTKAYIHKVSSSNKVKSKKQVFIFQFDLANKDDLGSGNWWFKTASSPNEFVLTRLKQKLNKNQRHLLIGKYSGIGASMQLGVDTKNTIPFTVKDLGNGRYEVKSKTNLISGEYCFFYQGATPTIGSYSNQSIFDFSVQ